MKPKATKERLEEKLDSMIAENVAATQRHDEQISSLIGLFKSQHEERMKQIGQLIAILGGK